MALFYSTTFKDPATVYAYSLIFVHHQVMWFMFIILGVVYWSFYKIVKEYNWNSFNKQAGILYTLSYANSTMYLIDIIFTTIVVDAIWLIWNYYVIRKSWFWFIWWKRFFIWIDENSELPNIFTLSVYHAWYRVTLTLETLTNYYQSTINHSNLIPVNGYNNIDNWPVKQHIVRSKQGWIMMFHMSDSITSITSNVKIFKLYERAILDKYYYYSVYNRANNAYMYSLYNREDTDFLKVQSYRDNLFLELIWAFFPSLIIFLILIPSLYLLYSLEENIQPKFHIKVIGHQWFWSYEFDSAKYDLSFEFDSTLILESDLEFGTKRLLEVSNRLYLPLNVPLRILVTSSDVLHSWAVPEMGIKVDAVPGRLNDCITIIRRPGVFYGQCSELCGVGHGFMPIVVEAVSYKKWISIISNL